MGNKLQLLAFAAVIAAFLPLSVFSNTENNVKPSLYRGPIKNQFRYVLENSSNYEDSKVVKTWWIAKLRNNITDTVVMYKDSINLIEKTIDLKNTSIDSLAALLATTNSDLEVAVNERDGITFFGILIDKKTYKGILWALVAILGLALTMFITLFKRSNVVTQRLKGDLKETQEEFENYRKRALEREEKKVRELYDEILKYKQKLGILK